MLFSNKKLREKNKELENILKDSAITIRELAIDRNFYKGEYAKSVNNDLENRILIKKISEIVRSKKYSKVSDLKKKINELIKNQNTD